MSYFLSFVSGTVCFYLFRFFPLLSIFLLLALTLFSFLLNKGSKRFYAMILIAAIAGFLYAFVRYIPQPSFEDISDKFIFIKGSPVSGAISRDSHEKFSQILKIQEAFDQDNIPLNINQLNLVSDRGLNPDKLYFVKVRMHHHYLNPGSSKNMPSGYAIEINEEGYSGVSSFDKVRMEARARLNNYIKKSFSEESAPFIMSIVTGERGLLTKEMRDAFNFTGLAHILSISGAHFGLLLVVVFGFFRYIIKSLPVSVLNKLTLYLTPSQISAMLCIPVMTGYLAISAMSVPSIRAFIMISLFLAGLLIDRRGFWLNTLLFAAFFIVLINPDAVLELSFQLSFVAVLGIGLVAGHMRDQKNQPLSNSPFKRYILLPALISLSATAGTAPIVAYHFHYLSIVSVITNVIITPFIGFIILPLSLIASFIFIMFGIFPLQSSIDFLTAHLIKIIMYIGSSGFSAIRIPAFPPLLIILFLIGTLFFIISLASKKDTGGKFVYPLLVFIVLSILPFIIYAGIKMFEYKGISITYLDAGQADASVIELPDGKTIVLDTGKSGVQVGQFLRYRGIKDIDALILSHGDIDHAGGSGNIIRDFNVHEIWDNGRLIYHGLADGIDLRSLKRGDVIEGKGYKIYALHPYDGFYTMDSQQGEENNDSLVIKIQTNHNSFLFTGDIESEAAEDISHLGSYLKSDVIKIPHHGSRSSASEVFINTVSPEIAVLSVGKNNTYGYPHEEMLDMLNGVKVFRTDIDGAIKITELKDGSLRLRTYSDFRLKEAGGIGDEIMNLRRLFSVW